MRAEILDLPAHHYYAYNQEQNELEGLFFMLVNEDRSLKITPVDEIREINDFCYYEYHADRHDAYYELVQEEFYKLFVQILLDPETGRAKPVKAVRAYYKNAHKAAEQKLRARIGEEAYEASLAELDKLISEGLASSDALIPAEEVRERFRKKHEAF